MEKISELKRRLANLRAAERQGKEDRWKRAAELWQESSLTAGQIARLTGFSRQGLHLRLGPRGTNRFRRVRDE